MNRFFKVFFIFMLVSGMLSDTIAQTPAGTPTFSQAELDQLLAPIALYPDPLLGQILVAATYPLETVQAARFIRQNPGLTGDALAQAIAPQSWDPSVKALTQFPSVLDMMDQQLAWTQKLGDAFLAQQNAVMDTVQSLRAKAQSAGTLTSNPQQHVDFQPGAIDIVPASPDTMYVPYYNPTVVYGSWWWPDYPPLVWIPPSEFQPPYIGSYFFNGIAFGLGVGLVDSLFFPVYPDWTGHHFVNLPHPDRGRQPWPRRPNGTAWTHDPAHRLGVAYRDNATRARFQPNIGNVNRDAYRGHEEGQVGQVGRPGFAAPVHPEYSVPVNSGNVIPARPENETPSRPRFNYPASPPQPAYRPPVEPAHPFMPSAPAAVTQSHSDRGQSSRASSGGGATGGGGSHHR